MNAGRPARILQLGLGARGRKWARIVLQTASAEAVGYVEPRAEAREAAAVEGLQAPVFADVDDALRAVEADVAVVVTPPQGRREVLLPLLTRRLALLVEKPLAVTLDEAAAIVRDVEAGGILLGIVQNFRYLPASQILRARIAERRYGLPTFGTVIYIRTRDGYAPNLNRYPLTMEHPMLLEQSIHHLDLVRYVYGREPEAVTAMTWNPPGSQYRGDSCAAALITMEGGLEVTYHGTWTSGANEMEFFWRTDCEGGMLIQRDLHGDLAEAGLTDAELSAIPLPAVEPFITDSRALLEEFLQAWRSGAPFLSTGRDHLRTLALTLACVESARTGKTVSLHAAPYAIGI